MYAAVFYYPPEYQGFISIDLPASVLRVNRPNAMTGTEAVSAAMVALVEEGRRVGDGSIFVYSLHIDDPSYKLNRRQEFRVVEAVPQLWATTERVSDDSELSVLIDEAEQARELYPNPVREHWSGVDHIGDWNSTQAEAMNKARIFSMRDLI